MVEDNQYAVAPTLYITAEFAEKIRSENVSWEDVLRTNLRFLAQHQDSKLEEYFQAEKTEVKLGILYPDKSTETLCSVDDMGEEFLDLYKGGRWVAACLEYPYIDLSIHYSYNWANQGEIRPFPFIPHWGGLGINRNKLSSRYQGLINLGYDIYADPMVKETFTMWKGCEEQNAAGNFNIELRTLRLYALGLTDAGILYDVVMGEPPSETMRGHITADTFRSVRISNLMSSIKNNDSVTYNTPAGDLYLCDAHGVLAEYMVYAIDRANDEELLRLKENWDLLPPIITDRYSHIEAMFDHKLSQQSQEDPFAQVDSAKDEGRITPETKREVK